MFVHAFANTTVANALFTLSAIPFITAILAFYFLNENLSIRTIIIMIIAFAGIVLMISEGLALGLNFFIKIQGFYYLELLCPLLQVLDKPFSYHYLVHLYNLNMAYLILHGELYIL